MKLVLKLFLSQYLSFSTCRCFDSVLCAELGNILLETVAGCRQRPGGITLSNVLSPKIYIGSHDFRSSHFTILQHVNFLEMQHVMKRAVKENWRPPLWSQTSYASDVYSRRVAPIFHLWLLLWSTLFPKTNAPLTVLGTKSSVQDFEILFPLFANNSNCKIKCNIAYQPIQIFVG